MLYHFYVPLPINIWNVQTSEESGIYLIGPLPSPGYPAGLTNHEYEKFIELKPVFASSLKDLYIFSFWLSHILFVECVE
jgi:hypothetical protein